jgi:hypothetical protein
MLGRTLLLPIIALALAACSAATDSVDDSASALAASGAVSENPDVQSAQEIAHARDAVRHDFGDAVLPATLTPGEKDEILRRYAYLDPTHQVPKGLLQTAIIYFDQNKAGFPNQTHITVVDLGQNSDQYRFFLVRMSDGVVEKYHTTHGIHSDEDDDGVAETFGNDVGSGKSSLGYVRTAEVYSGTYQRSVRLDGLSDTNSNIRERAVVFHGWDKVHEANVKQGLSWGCITLDWTVKDGVLDKIKEGSLMYVGDSRNGG